MFHHISQNGSELLCWASATVYKRSTYVRLLAFPPCSILCYFIKDFFCWTGLRQVSTILIETGYCHMCSLEGHCLLVHQHNKALLNTHQCLEYEEKLHLFQTTDCMLSTTMLYHATAQKFCKNKNSFSCSQSVLVTRMIQLHS